MLVKSDYEKLRDKAGEEGLLCHGEYNQHNVLLCKNQAAVTNFGHFSFDVQISDLYCFMRKILEKYNWDVFLARRMLEQYDKIRPISSEEWENLQIRFTYPEKYWKLANYYFSHNKAWISGKNTEKLEKVIAQKMCIRDSHTAADTSETVTPKNIILIMNESLTDFENVGEIKSNVEILPYIRSLNKNVKHGQLHVPTFGADVYKRQGAGNEISALCTESRSCNCGGPHRRSNKCH